MFKNYVKIAFRNLIRYKGISAVNIIGLATGMAAFVLVALYFQNEFSYDKFNDNFDRIYRVQHYVLAKDEISEKIYTPYPVADFLRENYPELERATVLKRIGDESLSINGTGRFFEHGGYYAKPSVFDMFTFKYISGNPQEALASPNQIILTNSLARKLFPDGNPVGKVIRASKNESLVVSGVIEDIPNNHFNMDYLVSFETYPSQREPGFQDNWQNFSCRNYVLLNAGVDPEEVNQKIYSALDSKIENNDKKLYLRPLADLHLNATAEQSELLTILLYYGGVSFFILLLACVNFINMTTARSEIRAREIGIRKVIGSSRKTLVAQFLGESFIVAFLAMLVSFVIAELLLPLFNSFTYRNMKLEFVENWGFVLGIALVFSLVGLLAGLYPSFYLASLKPLKILRGSTVVKSDQKRGQGLFRRLLVGFQFVISISLFIMTLFVYKHMDFMKNKDLGFEDKHLLRVAIKSDEAKRTFEDLRNSLLASPQVIDVAASTTIPFFGNRAVEINKEDDPEHKIWTSYNEVSYDFIDTYKIQLVNGRNFSRAFGTDETACIINETMAARLGWENPIGHKVQGKKFTIIGVVKDFHARSFQDKIRPYMMTLHSGEIDGDNLYSIRISEANPQGALSHIQSTLQDYFPNQSFQIHRFRDNLDNDAMKVWDGVRRTFTFFVVMAFLLAIIGLVGLVSFVVLRRKKEIGIRKVLGASIHSIFVLVTRDLLMLLAIAFLIGAPIAYLVSVYAPSYYKYEMRASDFALSALVLFGMAALTILHQSLKAAFANPVDSLRDE